MRYLLIAIFGFTAGLWGVEFFTLKGFMLFICLAVLSDAISGLMFRGQSMGWVNVYQRKDGQTMVTSVPKKSKDKAMQAGRLNSAESKYIGTIEIFK